MIFSTVDSHTAAKFLRIPHRTPLQLALSVMIVACAPTSTEMPTGALPRDGLPPNIVLMISDDHGFGDYGFMGSSLARTPRLDRLAENGTVLRAGFNTGSTCHPSLLTLLTGLYPGEFNAVLAKLTSFKEIVQISDPSLSLVQTLPRALLVRDYASLQTGKHWLGPHPWTGYTHGMMEWEDLGDASPGATEEAMEAGIRIVRKTMEPLWTFIDGHRDRPFFIWFAPMIPHYPHDAPSEYFDLYAEEEIPDAQRRYLASVSWFDAAVGELVDHLESRDLFERTLIVFLSDNGWDGANAAVFDDGPRGKASLYENGFRTPVVFHWPGRVPAGRTVDALISTVDLYPTLLDYAGVPKPRGRSGRNLRPLIEGHEESVRDLVVGHMEGLEGESEYEGGFFVRTLEWYFIQNETRPAELYAVVRDPDQARNVAEHNPDVVNELTKQVREWIVRTQRVPGGWRPEGFLRIQPALTK